MVIFALIAIIAVLVGVIVTLNNEIESLKVDVHYYTIENHRYIIRQVRDEHRIDCIIKQACGWKRLYKASEMNAKACAELFNPNNYLCVFCEIPKEEPAADSTDFLGTLTGILEGEDTNAV